MWSLVTGRLHLEEGPSEVKFSQPVAVHNFRVYTANGADDLHVLEFRHIPLPTRHLIVLELCLVVFRKEHRLPAMTANAKMPARLEDARGRAR